jgi:hypothetical protein
MQPSKSFEISDITDVSRSHRTFVISNGSYYTDTPWDVQIFSTWLPTGRYKGKRPTASAWLAADSHRGMMAVVVTVYFSSGMFSADCL